MITGTVCFGVTFILHLLGFGISRFYDTGDASAQECPCENPKFCERITDTTRKEVINVRTRCECVTILKPSNNSWLLYFLLSFLARRICTSLYGMRLYVCKCVCVCVCVYVFICLSVYLSIYLSIYQISAN